MSILDLFFGWMKDLTGNESRPPEPKAQPTAEDESLQSRVIVKSILENAQEIARNEKRQPGETVELTLVKNIPHEEVALGLKMNARDYGLLILPTDNSLSVRLQLLATEAAG